MFRKARFPSLLLISRRLGTGFALFILTVFPAHAQTANVTEIIANLVYSSLEMPRFIELIAYIMGLFAIYSGVIALRDASQKPGEKPIKPAIVRFIAAAALIALPRTIITTTKSFGNDELTAMPEMNRTQLMTGVPPRN